MLIEARRGVSVWGGGSGEGNLEGAPRSSGGIVAGFCGVSFRAWSPFGFADRRGGGRLGFAFGSSCSSRADTNEDGEDGMSLLKDEESLLILEADCVRSSDLGRPDRDFLLSDGWARPVGLRAAVNLAGFCLIGGVPSESLRSPRKLGPSC